MAPWFFAGAAIHSPTGRPPLGRWSGRTPAAGRGGPVVVAAEPGSGQHVVDLAEGGPVRRRSPPADSPSTNATARVDVGARHRLAPAVAAQRQPGEGVDGQLGMGGEDQARSPGAQSCRASRRRRRSPGAEASPPASRSSSSAGICRARSLQLVGRRRPGGAARAARPRRWSGRPAKSRGARTPRSSPGRVDDEQELGVAVEHHDQCLGGGVAEPDGRGRRRP